ncbi:MAG: hypothetical protein MRZ54_09680 [Clostridiales bacterium]|nr:hypothetical protein [Clostridiales bacterium]
MKKILALLLAAVMLTGVSLAMAENVTVSQAVPDFDVTMVIPQGYRMTENRHSNSIGIDVEPEDEAAARYYISIGYSEAYDGRTISDMDDGEVEQILDFISEGFYSPAISSYITAGGTLVYVLDENEAESDWAMAITIYRGYFITVQIEKEDYSELDEEDMQRAITLLSDMHFVESK